MPMCLFEDNRSFLLDQFAQMPWDDESGWSAETLRAACDELAASDESRVLVRARLFEAVLSRARLAADVRSPFVEAIDAGNLLVSIRSRWQQAIEQGEMRDLLSDAAPAEAACACEGHSDFGHIAPDWDEILRLGFPGLLARAEKHATDAPFSRACRIACGAVLSYVARLARHAEKLGMTEARDRLRRLCTAAPNTLPEALQFIDIVYVLLTNVEGENLRSLGRLDRLLKPYFDADLASGRYTREELAEYVRHFFAKMHAHHFGANVAFTLGGGADCEMAAFLVETYRTMRVHDPKMQIRVSEDTPRAFLRLVLDMIRGGLSSFAFVGDGAAISALKRVGVSGEDAQNYVLIGCYEPAACGKEVPCTCNGTVSFPKAVELALNDGVDPLTGAFFGAHTGAVERFDTFEAFFDAVKAQYRRLAARSMDVIRAYERRYDRIGPAPFYSATLTECVERGVDVYSGGAKYNNSSVNSIGLATAADSLAAIRTLVYEEQVISLRGLSDVLRDNWRENEPLRRRCMRAPKYGNGDARADDLAEALCALASDAINGQKNARGGVFRSGLFSIDWNLRYGEHTGATPDGRRAGEPISRNISASVGRDRAGVTALIRSVSALDASLAPNGSVLDLLLHPTVVAGDAGLDAMEHILSTFIGMGCFAMHVNVFDASTLRKAQREPEKYATLQVRVCGWNAYFVDLGKVEQDLFIERAERAGA